MAWHHQLGGGHRHCLSLDKAPRLTVSDKLIGPCGELGDGKAVYLCLHMKPNIASVSGILNSDSEWHNH